MTNESGLRPITMQDVRLAVGEGPLKPADVLAGCNAELARRKALISPAGEVGGWQPIETAPRDGTPCLFFQKGNKGSMHPRARADEVKVDLFSPRWPKAQFQLPEAPYTHWMPRPAAPRGMEG